MLCALEEPVNDSELAALADTNYFDAFATLGRAGGAPMLEEGNLLCIASATRVPQFNILFVTGPLNRPVPTLTKGIAFFDGLRLPFVMRIRDGIDPPTERAAEALGLSLSTSVPGMALFPVPQAPSPPKGLEIERVGRDRFDVFREVMAAGFGMPMNIARAFLTEAALEFQSIEWYLGSVDGQPVTTSTLLKTGRSAGVYNVATLGAYRRGGLGEAMTWHAVGQGARAGCDVSILQASEMGQAIYERMGYRLVAPYRTYSRTG